MSLYLLEVSKAMYEASLRAPRRLKKLIGPAPAGKTMFFYHGKSMIFIIKANWENELVATPVLACGSAASGA